MKKYKTYLKLFIYSVIFISVIIISYRSARPRYKPEHYTDIFKDFSWLNDWPKWLDFPLMQPLNSGFDWLITKYGIFFEGINFFLLGLYTSMKNSIVGLPWPLVIAIVILITYFASGRKNSNYCFGSFLYFLSWFSKSEILGQMYYDNMYSDHWYVSLYSYWNSSWNCHGKK